MTPFSWLEYYGTTIFDSRVFLYLIIPRDSLKLRFVFDGVGWLLSSDAKYIVFFLRLIPLRLSSVRLQGILYVKITCGFFNMHCIILGGGNMARSETR